MGRFVLRRMIAMIAVLFAISVVTFSIFNVIPNSDPALRLAGRNQTAGQIEAIRRQWGFDKPVYVQYVKTMQKIFTGDLISYSTQINVDREILQDIPRTFSLAIGAAIIWMAFAVVIGLYTAVKA
ncbi:MAG: peptide/nickel transport system permease protein, partial [Solirubrobacteraceae bacterium]|nr:peptide/nickel transport system permease protein [Solirubrobacteraceae bacterium]